MISAAGIRGVVNAGDGRLAQLEVRGELHLLLDAADDLVVSAEGALEPLDAALLRLGFLDVQHIRKARDGLEAVFLLR